MFSLESIQSSEFGLHLHELRGKLFLERDGAHFGATFLFPRAIQPNVYNPVYSLWSQVDLQGCMVVPYFANVC